ncbi:phosphoserine aminotransferase [Cucurbitaria berberidis CBS 394.84]|uniref:Phosphoserine aminotransferase n=1 Tax=Cucurbitaria berberidis CBS 394.84 TaxID=1168544 RepID=A0A9P4LER4_9PLEO|nr:phosphoserine aminotransferase [Cucurbitaria berberidis CBS 394.84]KAF1851632.1 phosphoserine aminotransferase [Cucurbitaria berberidis CBS 394.84]
MSTVAVAGGLGDLGRTIIDAVLASTPQHKIHILTRKTSGGKHKPPHGVNVVEVDYSSPSAMAQTLRDLKIDTVISTLNLDFEVISQSNINLIRGAAESGVVKRFIPSDFNVDYSLSEEIFPYPEKAFHQAARAELDKHAGLTYCSIQPGMFMDYYGMPHLENTYLKPLYIITDILAAKAAIPGDGKAKIAFTFTRDIGLYVGALLGLPAEKWPRDAICTGTPISSNELVELAEEVTGTKFDVCYDSLADLRAGKVTELPSNKPFYKLFPEGKPQVDALACNLGVAIANGVYDIKGTSLNKMFPDIKPKQMKELLIECWAGKKIG